MTTTDNTRLRWEQMAAQQEYDGYVAEGRLLVSSQRPEDQAGFDRDGRRKAQRATSVTNMSEELDECDVRIVKVRL